MAKFDFTTQGLGDIEILMSNQGISDLSWLSVDEAEYRASEALPHQNLDIIPEMMHAISGEESDVPHLVPMRPHVIVNRRPSDVERSAPMDTRAPIRNRVSAMVMMGMSNEEIGKRLSLEFSPAELRFAGKEAMEVLNERGVLGNVYVDASHFPRAAYEPKVKAFIKKYAKNALFVIGGCGGNGGCSCHETGVCTTFCGKRVVQEVPYDAKLAAHYSPKLAAEKRPIDLVSIAAGELPSSAREWKERIKAAFNQTPVVANPDGVRTVQTQYQPAKPKFTAADVEAYKNSRATATAGDGPKLSTDYVKFARRMMAGYDDTDQLAASTDPEMHKLSAEFGLLGHTYLDIDLLGGCRVALELVKRRSLNPDYIVRRSAACPRCADAEDGACAQLCRSAVLTHSRPDIDKMVFARALLRATQRNVVSMDMARVAVQRATDNSDWTKLTIQANLLLAAPEAVSDREYNRYHVTAHTMAPSSHDANVVAEMDPEEVRRTISHLMNQGLTGKLLQQAILQRYAREDLAQVPEVGRQASVDDGVQGIYFIDPTPYPDYGHGCSEGAKHFRKRGAPNVLASDSCTGCQLQTAPGWCSKYAKTLIRQIPGEVRAQAAAIRRLPVVQSNIPVENPVEQYGLASELTVDLNGSKTKNVEITIDNGSLSDED